MFSTFIIAFVLMFVAIIVMQFCYRRAQAQLSSSQRLIAFGNQSMTGNTIMFGTLLALLLLLYFFRATVALVNSVPVFLGFLLIAVALSYWFQYKKLRLVGLPTSYCKSMARAYLVTTMIFSLAFLVFGYSILGAN